MDMDGLFRDSPRHPWPSLTEVSLYMTVCWSVCLFVNSVDQDCHNGVWKTVNKCRPPRARTQRFRHVVSHDKPGSVRLEASLHHLFCLNLFSEPGLWTGQRVVILKLDKQPPASPAHSNWYLVLSLPPVSQLSSGFRIRKNLKIFWFPESWWQGDNSPGFPVVGRIEGLVRLVSRWHWSVAVTQSSSSF